MPKLRQALARGLQGTKLDTAYFLSCLMGNVEAMYELKDHIRYAVVSEDVVGAKPNGRSPDLESVAIMQPSPRSRSIPSPFRGSRFDTSQIDRVTTCISQYLPSPLNA